MRSALLLAALVLSGCVTAPLSPRAKAVAVTKAAYVGSCKPLGQVTGSSDSFATYGVTEARARALDAAGAISATHLVWLDDVAGRGVIIATGIAYRCE